MSILFNLQHKPIKTKLKLLLCLLFLSPSALHAYSCDESVKVTEALETLGYPEITQLNYGEMIESLRRQQQHLLITNTTHSNSINYILRLHDQGRLRYIIKDLQTRLFESNRPPVYYTSVVKNPTGTPIIRPLIQKCYYKYKQLPPTLRKWLNIIIAIKVGGYCILYKTIVELHEKNKRGERLTEEELAILCKYPGLSTKIFKRLDKKE